MVKRRSEMLKAISPFGRICKQAGGGNPDRYHGWEAKKREDF